ncbi:hypothetical protein N0V84_012736 [Fusarium piperis]|uniref:Uncharacterized protein n=1 Tax=Fusarium piperis TaxID=1435070 RepID=A0A9W8W3J0_9HYPO|nr:hypothetical protein N0V84_012736 [Fusarium piperis]
MDPFSFLTGPVQVTGPLTTRQLESYFVCQSQAAALLQKIDIVIRSATNLKAEGHRLLIYVKDPMSAREAHDMLQRAGLNTFDFCDVSHSRRERVSGLAKFNDPDNSEFDVFITSFRRGAGGGNFYGACYHGVIMEFPDDTHTLYRAQHSFDHIGQTERSRWVTIFYAAVGRFLMANPTTTDKFTKETMERIALRWEPGKEISMDRVVGNCPALPNGVKIYNFVVPGKGDDML